MAAMGQLKNTQGADKRKWTFGDLKRQGEDGTGHFKDSDISDLLTKATDAVAGSFRARGSPACMRSVSQSLQEPHTKFVTCLIGSSTSSGSRWRATTGMRQVERLLRTGRRLPALEFPSALSTSSASSSRSRCVCRYHAT